MSTLHELTSQRDRILAQIHNIESLCEGIENERNAQRVTELHLKQTKLIERKKSLSTELSSIDGRLAVISSEIASLSSSGIDQILDAIKEQRWYFIKNNPKIIFDRDTGILWANLNYFSVYNNNNDTKRYSRSEAESVVYSFIAGNFTNWIIPTFYDFKKMVQDKTFPFLSGSNYNVEDLAYYHCDMQGLTGDGIDLNDLTVETGVYYVIPCCKTLIENSNYETNISPNNPYFTEKERLMFTLDLFVQNDLWPIFNSEEITELYRNIFYEKPKLISQLQTIQNDMNNLQSYVLLSSEFDYTALLSKYDVKTIDTSIIKYYQAVQQWTDELLVKVSYYEKEKDDVIRDFNRIGIKFGSRYKDSDILTDEENTFFRNRQRYFASRFSLGMTSIKSKLIAVKHQADDLEYRIDNIDNGQDSIHQLALIEKEERASFSLIAENTAKIIRNALERIEFFEANKQYVIWAVQSWEQWTEQYKVFKSVYQAELINSCNEDGIEEEIWQDWFTNWQTLRFLIEQKLQPVIAHELQNRAIITSENEEPVSKQIIAVLETYRNAVDSFYCEERKGIYQNYAFQANGDMQDKIETESRLYRLTSDFQKSLQNIIFSCTKSEDRIFILNWADDLLDIQIDDILSLISDNALDKILEKTLTEFSELKKKNFEIYLADAESYGKEQAHRDKQFNSLLFKMRKGLIAR